MERYDSLYKGKILMGEVFTIEKKVSRAHIKWPTSIVGGFKIERNYGRPLLVIIIIMGIY